MDMNTGWLCPKCGRVYGPQWMGCDRCNAAVSFEITSIGDENSVGVAKDEYERLKANAALGALVRQMPEDHYLVNRYQEGWSVCARGGALSRTLASNTPEEALRAAMGKE